MNENFEYNIRKKFENFESEVSPDLFDKILIAREKRRRGAWLFLRKWGWTAAAILILFGTGISYLAFQGSEKHNADPNFSGMHTPTKDADTKPTPDNKNLIADPSVSTPAAPPVNLAEPVNHAEVRPAGNSFTDPESGAVQLIDMPGDLQSPLVETLDDDLADYGLNQEDNTGSEGTGQLSPELTDSGMSQSPEEDQNNLSSNNKNSIPSRWSLNLYAGPGLAYRNLRSDNALLLENRNKTERMGLSYQTGVSINYQWNKYMRLGFGISYAQMNTSFEYNEHWTSTDTSINTYTYVVINPAPIGNRTITVHDTSYSSIAHSRNHSAVNRFSVVTIPLEIERSFYFGDKWSVLAKAGISASIYSKRSGFMLNQNKQVTSLSGLPGISLGQLNSAVALGLSYRINPAISFQFYPQLNYSLNSGFDKTAGFAQRDYGVYTHFGLRIDL